MIYLDNAATTLPKPSSVCRAVQSAMIAAGNPGRGSHRAAASAAEILYDAREEAAALFGLDDPTGVVFTMNATHALNLAIKSTLHSGGHAVISGYEHNSVLRPLEMMENVAYTAAHSPLFDEDAAFDAMTEAVREDTTCMICTHVSNVFGFVLPIMRLDDFCAERGIPLILDASQSAGSLPIDVSRFKAVTFVCMPGHKGLYGPQGTGILLCCKETELHSLIEGGTGSESRDPRQPDRLPEVFESGTANVHGVAGLLEGLRFVRRCTPRAIGEKEDALTERLADRLDGVRSVTVFRGAGRHGPLSLTSDRVPSEELCARLAARGFCLRGGLHCAPLAHESVGTLEEGAVRVSPGWFNTPREIDLLAAAVREETS